MKNVLFLSVVMCKGYGVSVLYEQMARRLQMSGVDVVIGCQRKDDTFSDLDVVLVQPDPTEILRLADRISPCVIIAGTSPYFEVLPQLTGRYECWAWEAGDPTPELFPEEREKRLEIIRFKQKCVYPRVDRVVAISEFIRSDIGWPDSTLIYCGCNHVIDNGEKDKRFFSQRLSKPLRIGTLMRLGPGESQYKGNAHFMELSDRLMARQLSMEINIAGRGTADDAERFTQMGITPHLNLSDEEKFEYLRGLDVFVSMSKWEGFNLPVIEAQALGTLSLCFDIGAHPEVCPFVMRTLRDFELFIEKAAQDRSWLEEQSVLAYRYARSRFSWDQSVQKMLSLI